MINFWLTEKFSSRTPKRIYMSQIHVMVISEMNYYFESGIRQRLPYKRLFVAIWQRSVPVSLPYYLDFSEKLKRWILLFVLQSGFPRASLIWATNLWYHGPDSESSVSLNCSFFKPPKYASFKFTWDVQPASIELASKFILLPGNPEGPDIPEISVQSNLIRQMNLSQ